MIDGIDLCCFNSKKTCMVFLHQHSKHSNNSMFRSFCTLFCLCGIFFSHSIDTAYNFPTLVWHASIGCDSSGFFNEISTLLYGLDKFIPEEKLFVSIGRCSDDFLNTMIAEEALVLRKLQDIYSSRPPDMKKTIVVQHKLPGSPFHQNFLRSSITHPLYVIGRVMTESIQLNSDEIKFISDVDEVWVPSLFHKFVYTFHGISPSKIIIIPEAVNTNFYGSFSEINHTSSFNSNSDAEPKLKVFRFLSVFKWEHRKGVDILLRVYWSTFINSSNSNSNSNSSDGKEVREYPVILILRAYKPHWEPGTKDVNRLVDEYAALLYPHRSRQQLPPVRVISSHLTKREMLALYSTSDVFVLPTRGEGWCLPCVEALASGTPVIVTHFSGPSEYLNSSYSFPLRVKTQCAIPGTGEDRGFAGAKQELADYTPGRNPAQQRMGGGHTEQPPQQLDVQQYDDSSTPCATQVLHNSDGSVEPDEVHLSQLMGEAVQMGAGGELQAMGRGGQAHVRLKYSPEAVARLILAELARISEKVM